MESKSKVISIRLSEPEYLVLVEASKDSSISEFVRSAIQRAVLGEPGPSDETKEAARLQHHLRTLIQAKGKIQTLFKLWRETGKIEYLLKIKSAQEECPELQLGLEIDQALRAFAGD